MAEPAANNSNPGQDGNPATEGNPQSTPNNTPATGEIDRIVQSATDKVRQELWKEIKKKDAAIEDLKKSQMSEAELRKYKESQLAERETLLQRKELELLSVDVLRENDIPLSLRDFVIGRDSDETRARAVTLKTEFQKAVEAAVQERFKAAGRDPHKSDATPPGGKGRMYTRTEIAEMSRLAQDLSTPAGQRMEITKELTAAMQEGRIQK